MTNAVLKIALDQTVRELVTDLQVVSHLIPPGSRGLIITHDYTDLVVKGLATLKAYVPKKYKGFLVKFVTMTEEEMSLTRPITALKHGIFTP